MNSSQFPFSVITGKTIYRLISEDLSGCVNVVRDAYLAHAEGRSVNPNSDFLRFEDRPNARIIGLPSHLGDPWNISAFKWIASYPDNIKSGFHRASAVLLLNSHETGYPFACLEASVISAARTAASAVLAASHMRRGDHRAHTLGIVGTGLIARYVYRFLVGTQWEFKNIQLFDLDSTRAEEFAEKLQGGGATAEIRIAPDLPSLLKASDVVLFTTVAGSPHVHDPQLFEHRPLVLHLSLRDLAPEVMVSAFNIVDDVDHAMQANTSLHLTEQLTGSRDFVAGTVADLVSGRISMDDSRPAIFSPFGLGVLDLAVGKWVYDLAVAAGEHQVIDDFFDFET